MKAVEVISDSIVYSINSLSSNPITDKENLFKFNYNPIFSHQLSYACILCDQTLQFHNTSMARSSGSRTEMYLINNASIMLLV